MAASKTTPTITIPLVRGKETANTVRAYMQGTDGKPNPKGKALVWLDKAVLDAIGAADFEYLTVTVTAVKFDGEVNDLALTSSRSRSGRRRRRSPEPEATYAEGPDGEDMNDVYHPKEDDR